MERCVSPAAAYHWLLVVVSWMQMCWGLPAVLHTQLVHGAWVC